MSDRLLAPLHSWLTEPLSVEVARSVDRLRCADDVRSVALMPDVHLATEVCVGAVVATKDLLYPAAVGGDIGCGMAALAFDVDASMVDNEQAAARILAGLYHQVPGNKHRQARDLPTRLSGETLSSPRLKKVAERDGRYQLGTLGRGNHFLELQADTDNRLWVMIHSGSRAIGQAIYDWHLRSATATNTGLLGIQANSRQGEAYLADVWWARMYAHESRRTMLLAVEELLGRLFATEADWGSLIHADHNHVQQESHGDRTFWVHRKGAQAAGLGEPGIVPGSMGTASFHTEGRGCAESLFSCSHGAGRRLSRTDARLKVTDKAFARQVGRLWYDHRQRSKLHEEAPAAYKDIRTVMAAQRDLVRIVRELRPLLSYKGV